MSHRKLAENGFPPYYHEESADNIGLQHLAGTSSNTTYTIEEAIETYGFGWFQVRIILITGILQVANAMEMLLLSVLGPTLRCAWQINSSQVALITTIVFVGFLIGAPVWGIFSDRFGRKTCFVTVLLFVAYMGSASALSPNFIWLIILRGLVGFGIGGEASSYTLISEYLPIKYRAKTLMAISVFWAIGSSFEIGIAYLILPRFGWRWLCFASAVPLLVFSIFLGWLPESVRYLMAANKQLKAEAIIKNVAESNRCIPLEGQLVKSTTKESELGKLSHLWSNDYRCVTILQLLLWFGAAFSYYGIILISSILFSFHRECYDANFKGNLTATTSDDVYLGGSCCTSFTDDEYLSMLFSSFGEFAIIPFLMLANDCMGRRPSLACLFLLMSILFLSLDACMNKWVAITLQFVVRALASGSLSVAYLYTTEVYPTTVRSLGLGVCSSIARIGAILTPYVANVLMPDVSVLLGFSIYAGTAFLCAIGAFCLPIETRGRNLPNSINSEIEIPYHTEDSGSSESIDQVR